LVSSVYEEGWRSGCKGMTVYRENSRSGVLVSKTKEETSNAVLAENNAPKRPKVLECDILRFTNKGEKWIGFIGLNKTLPYEIFTGLAESFIIPNWVEKGMIRKEKIKDKNNELVSRYDFIYTDKEGYEVIMTGLNRAFDREYWNIGKMTSALLRHHVHMPSVIRIIESLKLDGDVMGTWKKGMIRMLKKYVKDDSEKGEGTCKGCGSHNLIYKEGCVNCLDCGWSKCS
jgi:ribonucleoside-diphosphate reductase alpha chain